MKIAIRTPVHFGGKASAYCYNCGHPFGGAGSSQGIWVWSHMPTWNSADGNVVGAGTSGWSI